MRLGGNPRQEDSGGGEIWALRDLKEAVPLLWARHVAFARWKISTTSPWGDAQQADHAACRFVSRANAPIGRVHRVATHAPHRDILTMRRMLSTRSTHSSGPVRRPPSAATTSTRVPHSRQAGYENASMPSNVGWLP